MQFVITNAGIAAAAVATGGGPKIEITSYKIGTAVAYTPVVGDTALHGTVLHTAAPSNYAVLSANTVQYMLTMDDTVGDFSFGEIGLYLVDGTLFALGSLTQVQQKLKTNGSTPGNIISIDARLNFSQLSAIIEFPITTLLNGVIPEISSIDLMTPPAISQANCYIVHSGDDSGAPIFAMRSNDYEWRFNTHNTLRIAAGVVGTGQDVDSAAINGAGTGYHVNDVLTFVGGTFSVAGQVTVVTVDGSGAITGITLTEDGVYSAIPTNPVEVTGGNGTSATFTLTWGNAVHLQEIVSSDIGLNLPEVQAGKYVMQITSGTLRGFCRHVTISKNDMMKWSTPLGSVPSAGVTFDVYQSDSSIIADAFASVDAAQNALAYAIVFGQ